MSQKNCYPSLRRNALRYMVSPNRSPINENGVQFCGDFFAGLSSKGKLIFFLLLRFVDEKKKQKKPPKCWAVCCYLVRAYRYALDRFAVCLDFRQISFSSSNLSLYIPYSIVATCKLYWFDCRTSFPSFIFIFLRNSDAHIFWIIKKEIKAKNSCQSRSQHIRTKRWQKIKK